MTARTHDLIAFSSLLVVATHHPQTVGVITLIAALIANIVGALFPDIDQATNRLWDLLPGGNLVGKYLRRIFLRHRTLSHSLLGSMLVYQLVYWLFPQVFNTSVIDSNILVVAFMTGYLSHLGADSFTEEGLPLLFPFTYKFGIPPVKSWRIKTGQWFEKWIVFPSVVLFILGYVFFNFSTLVRIVGL